METTTRRAARSCRAIRVRPDLIAVTTSLLMQACVAGVSPEAGAGELPEGKGDQLASVQEQQGDFVHMQEMAVVGDGVNLLAEVQAHNGNLIQFIELEPGLMYYVEIGKNGRVPALTAEHEGLYADAKFESLTGRQAPAVLVAAAERELLASTHPSAAQADKPRLQTMLDPDLDPQPVAVVEKALSGYDQWFKTHLCGYKYPTVQWRVNWMWSRGPGNFQKNDKMSASMALAVHSPGSVTYRCDYNMWNSWHWLYSAKVDNGYYSSPGQFGPTVLDWDIRCKTYNATGDYHFCAYGQTHL